MGTKLIDSYTLISGESVWAVYWTVEMPDLSGITQGTGTFYKNRSHEDLKSGDFRALVFGTADDESRVIYDCAVVGKNP